MQFMPETAVRYGLKNPHDPKAAIDAAAHYLRDLLERFNGRVDLAVAAYNAGEGAVESFRTGTPLVLRTGKIINGRRLVTGGVPPYPETRAYVRSILSPLIATQTINQKPTRSQLIGKRFHSFNGQDFIFNTPTNPAIKNARRLNSFIDVQ
jgi:soluble lytic murein transglycosylase-like protein